MVLSDLDQRIIHAVQVSPRAPWSALAPVVGADAVTIARRWERLREQGIVYATGYGWDSSRIMSLIEIECVPGHTLEVAADLAGDAEAFTIDLTAGGRDIMLSLISTDTADLGRWTLERVQRVEGIRAIRTHLISEAVTDARGWRLRALSSREEEAIRSRVRAPAARMPRLADSEIAGVVQALAIDGRAPVSEIAARAGISPRKAREAVAAMMASGRLVVRIDIARPHTPWPVYAWYFLQVPAAMVPRVGPLLGQLDEARLVVTAAGAYNVLMAAWMRTLQDVNRLETMLEERLPGVHIVDRSVVLRSVKHLGHLLDADGSASGRTVPMS